MRILILSIFLLVSCSDKNNIIEDKTIKGTWSLTKHESGFSKIKDFNISKILWTFNKNNILEIKVDNSVTSSPLFKKGKYTYSINKNRILINKNEFDFLIDKNTLIISDNPTSDGSKTTLTRIK